MTETGKALDIIRYWLGIAECDCNSILPHGACLYCDLQKVKAILLDCTPPKYLPLIPDGYYYAGIHRISSLLLHEEARVAHKSENEILGWSRAKDIKNKSQTELIHTIFKSMK